jgi:hypothetical protein
VDIQNQISGHGAYAFQVTSIESGSNPPGPSGFCG